MPWGFHILELTPLESSTPFPWIKVHQFQEEFIGHGGFELSTGLESVGS